MRMSLDQVAELELPEDGFNLRTYHQMIDAHVLRQALIQTGYNKSATAEILGMSLRWVRYTIKEFCPGLENRFPKIRRGRGRKPHKEYTRRTRG